MLVDRQRRVLDEIVGAVEHEAAAGLDRAAAMDLHAPGRRRQADLRPLGNDVELDEEVAEGDLRRPAG